MGNVANSGSRRLVLAALAILRDGEGAAGLADYMAPADAEAFGALAAGLREAGGAELEMQKLVRHAVAAEGLTNLAEVHPGWILDQIRAEPPRVVGLLLRSLPSRHVRYILKNMPPMQRALLPDMIESFAAAEPILAAIRRRFERHFLPMPMSRAGGGPDFAKLYHLKGEDLEEVIREVGLAELGMALTGVSGKALRAVLNRLDIKDAKRLQRRMRELADVPAEAVRQARRAILDVEACRLGPDETLMKLGIASLAGAMDKGHGETAKRIEQRLDPSDGYLLRRLVAEMGPNSPPGLALFRQGLILSAAASLAGDGRISLPWSAAS